MKPVWTTLIQLSRYERDLAAQAMADLDQKIQTLTQDSQRKKQTFLSEQRTLASMKDLGLDFQGFYRKFQIEQELLKIKIQDHQAQYQHHYQELITCFEREKKYEHVKQERQKLYTYQQERQNHQALDEWTQRLRFRHRVF